MTIELSCDVLVIGGGTAGSMAAITAAEAGRDVLLLEKAHVRHSGALAMGMDGVNNAVIPGKARPEDYVAEITRANDGIVNQRTVMQTATRGFDMVQRLERYGVKFEKDSFGEYHVRQVHRSGSYVLPMPEGKDVKKVLYRVMRERRLRERLRIENRVMPVRVLVEDGRAVGAAGFHTRTGEFVTVSAGAVVLATGASGRLGLPASGYLYGTYENPTNAGDGYSMAYHAGAELSGIECFQINPLIKDYNGPACAYVGNPFGAYQVNSLGERFVDCDYWSGQMMAEVAAEIASARGPIYLKTTHLPEESITALEGILHSTERPSRGTFHSGRGHDYRTHDIEMHISEIGLCGGHSASGVWVDENGLTTVPGLYAAGDLACVPHNYMIGAFVFGDLAGAHASAHFERPAALPAGQVAEAHELIFRHSRQPDGPPQPQVEYKLRRFVNDYVAPPKSETKLSLALEAFARMESEIAAMGARSPHELMRCVEVSFIRDCAEMAAASSLMRDESRWGLYHSRVDLPERDDERWFHHLNLRKNADGAMEFIKRPVAPYLVPVDGVPHRTGVEEFLGVRTVSVASEVAQVADDEAVVESARVLEVLALADAQPALADLEPYLADLDPVVRRAAVSALTEAVPEGFEFALVQAMADTETRAVAAAGLRELVEVVPASEALREALELSPARAIALEVLWALKLGTAPVYAAGLTDDDLEVRQAAVRGLVALREDGLLATAASDPSRELRVQVAKGITDISVLATLTGDDDPLVRAAALEAAERVGHPAPLNDLAAGLRDDPAWEVRVGAAKALTDPELVIGLAGDTNLDVRKAAVRALARWLEDPSVVLALKRATDDTDADVRAYARRALG
ncbi:fumarate reductase/succinate dehydrogenase flavoprotein subunit [Lentzea californiensis]|uniref:fumarate reductase/succinate dehydrogenase flavoprotein subunit n=1 Tax=Lentzea californiensis TaxID=438851 RepID=UPI0027DA413B|nr:fumarate reductase/succinate dehydrogenase flavoprotein subunit [Lentzea californiensis]MCR3750327.1 Succinate dehydrogenase/fumarate reductase, flavoprotein subunit [Lentzea californiensis]